MSPQYIAFFFILALSFTACQLRMDNRQQDEDTNDNVSETPAPVVEKTLPTMREVRLGYFAMLVTGNASSYKKGLFQGEATFSNTSTPVINSTGVRGNIKKEISFLYSQGLIRKLKIHFVNAQLGVQTYPLISYANFRNTLPEDSVAATYIIASNNFFDSYEGQLEIHNLSENLVQGMLKGLFVSERADSIMIQMNFKAIKE
jgi:hypothetical protein